MGFDSLLLEGLSLLSWSDLSCKDMSEDFIDTSGVEAVKWLPLANGYTNVLSIILNDLCFFILLIKSFRRRENCSQCRFAAHGAVRLPP